MGCGFGDMGSICEQGSGRGKEKWMRDRCEEESLWGTEGEGWWTYLAGKRNEMVFTEAVDGDFPDQDHLVMIFGEDGVVDNV